MPDTVLAQSETLAPRPVMHPGSVFPEVHFQVQRIKVTLVATLELTTQGDIRQAKECVDRALTELRVYARDRMSVSYEKL